jgi:3-hydroxyisobutyrate dehydrogenase-like beta-hydroxyacid dehydrogenase
VEPPQRVAFLGLGIMGSRMAANLARAGFELTVWNRTREKADAFAREHGARLADTPADAARAAEVTITMVVDAPHVEEVMLGPGGASEGMEEGHLAIDMSTIPAATSRALGERLGERGIHFLDAPVTGSKPKAEDGTLVIMVGGEADQVERARPLFEAMGERVVHAGAQGEGSLVKLLNNTLAAINAAALAQAIRVAEEAGTDLDALFEVAGSGSGDSAMLRLKGEPMRERHFEPLFRLAHMLKDVRHCLRESESAGASFGLARHAEELYARADREGHGDEDFAAVIEAADES